MFRVLTMHNKLVTVNSQAVTKKRPNKFAAALDSENKTINPMDIVKVIDGVNKVSIILIVVCLAVALVSTHNTPKGPTRTSEILV